MSITLDIVLNTYVLSGDTARIRNVRRIKSNFASIGAIFKEDSQIIIPFSTEESPSEYDDKEQQYAAISRLLNKFDIVHTETEQAQNLLTAIKQENDRFDDFSLKAKNIRNNICDSDEFKSFVDSLKRGLNRNLYRLQLLSSYHLAFAQNACNFSVPGAGKTSIVYGAYAYLRSLPEADKKHVDRMLVICPLAAFAPWKNEYRECFGVNPSVKELVGVSLAERELHFGADKGAEITLISYQSASSEADVENITSYLQRHSTMVVLDEAHRIKNVAGGKWAQAVLKIAKYAKSRVVLTGTPAPNGYQDLYNLYKFIWPSKDIIRFPVHYLQDLSNNDSPSVREGVGELIERISPFFIRIKKSHLGLPKPIENDPIVLQMSVNQRMIYDFIEQEYVKYFEDTSGADGFMANLRKAKLIRLMQCVTNPHLLKKPLDEYIDEEGISNLGIDDKHILGLIRSCDPTEDVPPKFVKTLELIESIKDKRGADGKIVIWTIFIQNIFDLRNYLHANGISSELLYGAVPSENQLTIDGASTRERIIEEFHKEDCRYRVIIANPFAVGESISLHKACHNAIYLEKNFNAAMYMQSKDRVHRYGLEEDDVVNYYYLLSENSIDEVIHDRVLQKEERMLEIIEKQEIPLLDMNSEESDDETDDINAIIQYYHARKSSTAQ